MKARDGRRVRIFTGVMLAAMVALTGCSAQGEASSSGSSTDDIASVETTSPGTAGSAVDPLVAAYGEPIRLRLDMTEEDEAAAYAVYDTCVAEESGVDMGTYGNESAGADEVGAAAMSPEDTAKIDAASEACMVVSPLPPVEYDAQNPDAVNFVQAVVDCLHERGVTFAEVSESDGRLGVAFGGDENDSGSISLGMQYYDSCEAEVVAAGTWDD